eukprot:m51a1_g10015 putative btb poz domain-containing protein kctd9-like (1101) ;mRNA; f:34984-39974
MSDITSGLALTGLAPAQTESPSGSGSPMGRARNREHRRAESGHVAAIKGPRVTSYENGYCDSGRTMRVPAAMELLLEAASMKLQMKARARRVFLADGGEIDDIGLVRDGDVLYFSAGEPFKRPYRKHATGEMMTLFATTRGTLTFCKDSMLTRMFGDDWDSHRDIQGNILIDRNPDYFGPVLNFLRCGSLIIDQGVNPLGVYHEAKFFGLTELQERLAVIVAEQEHTDGFNRKDFIGILLTSSTNSTLRCQGLNLAGINLSRLDLSNINFRMTNFVGARLHDCNMDNCQLQGANLEGADLTNTTLRGANLGGTNLVHANLRGANLEDRGGSCANLEGANMRGINLEDGNLVGVDLRAANMRGAVLVNCNLLRANFAGADLEDADLRGANVHKANLIGCNLKGAIFDIKAVSSRPHEFASDEPFVACVVDPATLDPSRRRLSVSLGSAFPERPALRRTASCPAPPEDRTGTPNRANAAESRVQSASASAPGSPLVPRGPCSLPSPPVEWRAAARSGTPRLHAHAASAAAGCVSMPSSPAAQATQTRNAPPMGPLPPTPVQAAAAAAAAASSSGGAAASQSVVAESPDLELDVYPSGKKVLGLCSLDRLIRWVCEVKDIEDAETLALTHSNFTTPEYILDSLISLHVVAHAYKEEREKEKGCRGINQCQASGTKFGIYRMIKALVDLGFESQTPALLKRFVCLYELSSGDMHLRWAVWAVIRSLYSQTFSHAEMVQMVRAMQEPHTGIFLKTNQKRQFFTGQDFFDWMHDVAGVCREDAQFLGEEMVRRGFIKSAFKSEGLLPNANLYFPSFAMPEEHTTAAPCSLGDCSVSELAQQLCLREQLLFKAIKLSEFRGCAWTKPAKLQTSPNIIEMIHFSNKISYWIATEIVCSPDPKRRQEVLRRAIALAQSCYEANCFSAVAEILGGLQHMAVRRLRSSWMGLPYKYRQMLHEMLVLMQPDDNWKNYRACIRHKVKAALVSQGQGRPLSVVPHLGVYLTDITFIETNQDSVRGLVNFRKMRLLGSVLRELRLFQRGAYEYRYKDDLQELFAHSTLCPSSDEELAESARFNESEENPFNTQDKTWNTMEKLQDLLAALPVTRK